LEDYSPLGKDSIKNYVILDGVDIKFEFKVDVNIN